ncbi:hypothetical protein [Bradyrhizobium japonicum]|uniref:hypothetical protein n=1 Tax=Bradyrhizobium japonicum TaxID=375 RepID=UPI0012FD49F1|nr:hypothetical protein [Bradyrhizobium japonicum]
MFDIHLHVTNTTLHTKNLNNFPVALAQNTAASHRMESRRQYDQERGWVSTGHAMMRSPTLREPAMTAPQCTKHYSGTLIRIEEQYDGQSAA